MAYEPGKRINVAGFWVREMQGSGEYQISDGGISATRRFLLDEGEALNFALKMKGQPRQFGDILTWDLPATHPKLPGLIYVSSCNVSPDAKSKSKPDAEGMISYARNWVEVTYALPRHDKESTDPEQNELGVIFTEDIDFSAEVMVIPGGSEGVEWDPEEEGGPIRPLKPGEVPQPLEEGEGEPQILIVSPQQGRATGFVAPPIPPEMLLEAGHDVILSPQAIVNVPPVEAVNDQIGGVGRPPDPEPDDDDVQEDNKVKQDVNVLIGSEEINLEFPMIRKWHRPALRIMTGRVNEFEFLDSPPEHLLYLGARTRKEVNAAGLVTTQSLTLRFKHRQYSWNREWKPKTKERAAGWARIVPPLYGKIDFKSQIRKVFFVQ